MKLKLESITKFYGKYPALQNVSATLTEGVYGLLGPNGAGKTTLINILIGILPASGGVIYLDGENTVQMGGRYFDQIGYMPQYPQFYANFTVQEFLDYMCQVKGVANAKQSIDAALVFVNLEENRSKRIGALSGGMRQRLGVAPEEFFLLSVGELNQNKNHQVVLEALSRLKRRGCLEGIRYGICGEGFARPQLEEEIRARGLSQVVTLYGYRPDIPQMVGCADATVFPSRREGLGMAGLESLAMGVPVLAADNRGTREYMSFGKNGLLYPWDDPAGFARGIALLRGMDPRRRELLSQRCVASVAPFDRACSQAVMQAVYQEMERKVRERCEQKTLGHRADGLL